MSNVMKRQMSKLNVKKCQMSFAVAPCNGPLQHTHVVNSFRYVVNFQAAVIVTANDTDKWVSQIQVTK